MGITEGGFNFNSLNSTSNIINQRKGTLRSKRGDEINYDNDIFGEDDDESGMEYTTKKKKKQIGKGRGRGRGRGRKKGYNNNSNYNMGNDQMNDMLIDLDWTDDIKSEEIDYILGVPVVDNQKEQQIKKEKSKLKQLKYCKQ
ncbi:MAG: hypothetical protein EZS28_012332 [Streblomastix strix]|uniref:Uncharacterized protein n=1 Tax=Streblomastix strix TaxID=222440 RepID=A0A5J4WBV1_9EUKA|nr:MAG: hypothetical protein EZS28_012332 [Streblomastix strix]